MGLPMWLTDEEEARVSTKQPTSLDNAHSRSSIRRTHSVRGRRTTDRPGNHTRNAELEVDRIGDGSQDDGFSGSLEDFRTRFSITAPTRQPPTLQETNQLAGIERFISQSSRPRRSTRDRLREPLVGSLGSMPPAATVSALRNAAPISREDLRHARASMERRVNAVTASLPTTISIPDLMFGPISIVSSSTSSFTPEHTHVPADQHSFGDPEIVDMLAMNEQEGALTGAISGTAINPEVTPSQGTNSGEANLICDIDMDDDEVANRIYGYFSRDSEHQTAAMRRIIESFARRDDITDEWWASVGLTRVDLTPARQN